LQLHSVDLVADLTNTLTAIVNGEEQGRIDELLPWISSASGSQALTLNASPAKLTVSSEVQLEDVSGIRP
jgi:hypothetical protein